MAADLWPYWMPGGRYRAGSRRLEGLLEIEPTPSPTRAMALSALGYLAQATGDYARALSALEEARLVCDEAAGDRFLAYVLDGLAQVHLRRKCRAGGRPGRPGARTDAACGRRIRALGRSVLP